MTEENNNQNDQHTDWRQRFDEIQTELDEISKEKLKQILEDHRKWLESDGKEGGIANLRNVNLEGVSLVRVNLEGADLRSANLQKVMLNSASLQGADLFKANLQNACLIDANLQKVFLNSASLQGANLLSVNLQNASLQETNLQGTWLQEANLQGANLFKSDLRAAKLSQANLRSAILNNSDLQNTTLYGVKGLSEAELQYANLEGASGLLGNEFAQANVTGTKLPEDIKKFKALETVEKTSQNARKIFFAMLLGCVYSWLTIATTTDVRLLTNTASSPLPIIGTEIPIAWFYIAAPLVLICLYFYFHLYLDNLWEGLASLPAIFPDGKRLDQRAYPWLLNTLVRKHFKRLKKRPLIARMKEWITIFLAWWVVPITMMAFWLRYIPRHDWIGTIFHIGFIVVSVGFAIIFYRLCALTLQGKERTVFRIQSFWNDRRFYYGVSMAIVAVFFYLLSYGSIEGVKLHSSWDKRNINKNSIKAIIPYVFNKIGYNVFVDFSEKDISEKPENYWEIPKNIQLKSVRGANLQNSNLNNANMYSAFLVKADLRNAELQNVHLVGSNLEKADLDNANLKNSLLNTTNFKNTNLTSANMENASLFFADFSGSSFHMANIKNANLENADFRRTYLADVDFRNSNLKNADFQDARMSGADLTGVKNLSVDQLSNTKTLRDAKLDPKLMEQVKKCCPHLLEKPKKETDQKNNN